jgi:alpha-amylase
LQSGLAVVISNSQDGEKRMYIGTKFSGNEFIDALGKCQEKVQIDEEGYGIFKVKEKSVSVWVKA